jgi:hypothetical protein
MITGGWMLGSFRPQNVIRLEAEFSDALFGEDSGYGFPIVCYEQRVWYNKDRPNLVFSGWNESALAGSTKQRPTDTLCRFKIAELGDCFNMVSL